jgi:integrase
MVKLPGFNFNPKAKIVKVEVILPGNGGHDRRRGTFPARTMKEATKAWSDFRERVLAGKSLPHTLGSYVEAYWPSIAKRLAPRTAKADQSIIERRILPVFRDVPLEKINAAAARDFAAKLKKERYHHEVEFTLRKKKVRRTFRGTYSASTINDTLAVLRLLLRDAVDRDELAFYPIKGRLPKERETVLRLELSPAELAAFLGSFDDETAFLRHLTAKRSKGAVIPWPNHPDRKPRSFGGGPKPGGEAARYQFQEFRWAKPLFVVALETGLSRGDLRHLKWNAIDTENGWIRVPRNKTGVEATIPISTDCAAALEECRRRQAEALDEARHRDVADLDEVRARIAAAENVFLTSDGLPFSDSTIDRRFDLAKELAGITRRLRFHDLRHTFASRLASQDVPIQKIAKTLGHASTRMSERYARPSEDSLRSMKSALDATNQSSAVNSSRELPAENERAAESGGPASPLVPGKYMERAMGFEPTTFSLGS